MKTFFNLLYYLFVTCIVGIAILLLASMVPVPGNIKVKIVKSGSMEPTIKTGGIVVIAPSDTYSVGDVITFGQDTKTQIPTTHRIVRIEGDGPLRAFATKGDANSTEDPAPTRLDSIKGKMIFTVPYLGYILDFAKKPSGFVLLVGIPALMIIFDELSKIFTEIKSIRRKKFNSSNQDEQREQQ